MSDSNTNSTSDDGASTDRTFAGSIPQFYERYMVPLIFEPYAADMASRARRVAPARVLEIAAGTGVVTRALATALPHGTSIVATDLNQAMLDHAATVGTSRPVTWRQADAMQLPFADEAFDLVVCQFGVMFFPDKGQAFAQARRVLRPGGTLLFNVWDAIDQNEFADTVTQALAQRFPADPPRFLARVPHGHHDCAALARDLLLGGFTRPADFSTVTERSVAASPRVAALAYCQGTPLRSEIESRGAALLDEATAIATEAIARRFGSGIVSGKIQAHVVAVER